MGKGNVVFVAPGITRGMVDAGLGEFEACRDCVDPEGMVIAVYTAMRAREVPRTEVQTAGR
jgi:hypothetical protein